MRPDFRRHLIVCLLAMSPLLHPDEPLAPFAPGVISSPLPEFATTVTDDGATIAFNRTSADRDTMWILVSERTSDGWTEPRPLPFSTGTWRDVDPFFTPDGRRLYFSSNRPTAPGDTIADFNTWFVERSAEGWSAPRDPGAPLNSPATEIFVSITRDGEIFFSREDGEGPRHIVHARLTATGATEPRPIAFDLPASVRLGNPAISPDGRTLVVATRDLPGLGGPDLYVSFRTGADWTRPVNAGARINSAHAEFAPAFSPDGRHLFFTSERPGVVSAEAATGRPPGDIYRVPVSWLPVHPNE